MLGEAERQVNSRDVKFIFLQFSSVQEHRIVFCMQNYEKCNHLKVSTATDLHGFCADNLLFHTLEKKLLQKNKKDFSRGLFMINISL